MATIRRQVASRQLDTGGVVRFPTRDPVADALTQAGGAAADIGFSLQERYQQQQDRLESFQAARRYDTFKTEQAAALDKMQAEAEPGAAGLTETALDSYDQAAEGFLGELSPRLQQEYSQLVRDDPAQDFRAPGRAQFSYVAAGRERDARYDYYRGETKQALQGLENVISQVDPDAPGQYETFLRRGLDTIAATGLPAQEREELAAAWRESAAVASWRALLQRDPAAAKRALGFVPSDQSSYFDRLVPAEGAGDNPRSSAEGVGQFLSSTWLRVVRQYEPELAQDRSRKELLALRKDGATARRMLRYLTRENEIALQRAGQPVTDGTRYLAHFAGAEGAIDVLNAAPDASVRSILGENVVKANPFLRGMTAAEMIAWADRTIGAPGSSGADAADPRFQDIPLSRRLTLATSAEQALNRRNSAYRSAFDDYLAFVRNGGEPSGQFERQGVERTLGPDSADELDRAVRLGQDVRDTRWASPDELAAMVQERRADLQSPEDFRANVGDLNDLLGVVDERNKRLADDPAAYVAQDETIGRLYQNIGEAGQAGNPQALRAASAAYAQASLAEQQRLGLPRDQQRITTDPLAASLVAGFENQDEGGQNAAQIMQGLADQWDEYWPQVFAELSPDLPTSAYVIGTMNRPSQARAAERLAEAAKLGTSELNKLLPNIVKRDLTETLSDEMTDFRATLVDQVGGLETFGRFMAGAELLAQSYALDSGDGTQAARRAVQDIVDKAYTLHDTFRVPVELDGDLISGNAAERKRALDETSLLGVELPTSLIGLDEEEARAAYLASVRANGFWVTAPEEDGLVLYDGTRGAVHTPDGRPAIMLTWEELSQERLRQPAIGFDDRRERLPDFGIGTPTAEEYRRRLGALSTEQQRATEPILPVNMRTFISTLFGSRADITEKDFSASDRNAILSSVKTQFDKTGKREGVIGYGDYGAAGRSDDYSRFGSGASLATLVIDSFTDPRMRLETTLGMARYKIAKDGTVTITDRYRFDATRSDLKNDPGLLEAFRLAGWTGVLNLLGNRYGPTEDEPGRKVNLKLGKI